jgi:hypothetical protein
MKDRGKIHARICGGDHRHPGRQLIAAARMYAGAPAASILLLHGHHPAHHRARTTSNPWPTWPCSAATWANPAAASIRCAARTTSRAPATWAACPTCYTAYQPVDRPGCQEDGTAWGVTGLPTKPGLKVTEMVPKAHDGAQGPVHHRRKPAGVRSGPEPRRKVFQQPGFSGGPGHFSHRNRPMADVVCRPPVLPKKTAPSPTPSAGCSGCAKPWTRPARPRTTGRSPARSPPAWATRCPTRTAEAIFDELPR